MILTLTESQHVADNVWRFSFAPKHPVSWRAGQFIRLEVPHTAPDASGTLRWFTISAAPFEKNLTVTTRLSQSSFKRALMKLKVGDQAALVEQPAGDFVWRTANSPRLFAAQGIGITPFYAIIKDRLHHRLPIQATLIYAHQPGSTPIYGSELQAWAKLDPTLKLIEFTGTLQAADIAGLVPNFSLYYVYVSGPKSFLRLSLPPHALPLNQLKQDNFPGYSAAQY